MNERITGYTVLAGKFEDEGENIKYIEDFSSLDEALSAFDAHRGYQWCRIELIVE